MRFRHELTGKNTAKRVVSFLLMLCLLVPMLPSSIGLEAKADDTTTSNTVTIKLHDLYIDRKEALPDGTDLVKLETAEQGKDVTQDKACLLAYKYARSIIVKKGTTLSQLFAEAEQAGADSDLKKNTTLGTSSLAKTKVYKSEEIEDANAMTSVANAKDCIWYTRDGENGGVDGNGARTQVTGNTVINDNIDLYTYSYRLRLVTGKQEYKDLIVREGQEEGFIYGSEKGRDETCTISDFLANNNVTADWTDVNLGTTLTNTTQFNNGITQNYILRANGVNARTQTVDCKVAVNGSWVSAGTISLDLDRVDVWGKTGPALNYYVTDAELKNVYEKYGFGTDVTFEGGEISKEKNGYFPYSNGTGANLYIRQMPKHETIGENQTQFRVPLIEDTISINEGGLSIYYTPHNTTDYDSRFLDGTEGRNGWASPNDSAVLRDNSFYTVSVDDADKTQFDNSTTLPNKDEYHLYGSKVEFTLPLTDKDGKTVKWYVEKGGDNVTIKENGDTATVTVDAIDKQLVLTTDDSKEYAYDVQVHCFVLVNGEPKEIGKLHTHATQQYDAWGNSQNPENKTRYYVTAEQAETVFGEFGFKASEFDPDTNDSQKYIFANTTYEDADSKKIWTDAVPAKFDDVYKIPLAKSTKFETNTTDSKDLSLYYIPKNTTNGEISVTADTLKTSTFYSISTDVEGTKFSNLPETKYVLNETSTTIDLPSKDADGNTVTWYPEKGSDILTIVKKDDNTVTVSITNIDKEVVLTTDASKQDADAIKVHCYILVDGQPVEVGLVTTKNSVFYDKWGNASWGKNNQTRYYITANQIADIYKKYGFDVSKFDPDNNANQKYIWGVATYKDISADDNSAKIWADTPGHDFNDGEGVKIPLINQNKGNDKSNNYKSLSLYYVPNNTKAEGYNIADLSKYSLTKDTTFLNANSVMFSVTAKDEANKFDETLPEAQYVLSGEKATVTLPYSKDTTWTAWYCSVDGTFTPIEKALVGTKEEVNTKEKSITFTFSEVSAPILITTSDKHTEDKSEFITLTAYVALNGTWTKVETKMTGIRTTHVSSNSKYYITAEELEYIYGKYGFKSTDWDIDTNDGKELTLFGCEAGRDIGKIWADNVPVKQGSSWYLPLVKNDSKTGEIQVYYLPNNTSNTEFGTANHPTRDTAAKENAFYSIKVQDPDNQFTDTKLPEDQILLNGESTTIELPYKDGVTWTVTDQDGALVDLKPEKTEDGTKVKITVPSISCPLIVTTKKATSVNLSDKEVAVNAYVSIDDTWVPVRTEWQYTDGKFVGGSDSFSIENSQTTTDSRYYLTVAQLEQLFGTQYGFSANSFTTSSKNCFPHSTIRYKDSSSNSIYGDTDPFTNGSNVCVPFIKTDDRNYGISIYYIPNTTGTTESWLKTDQTLLSENCFSYSMSAADPLNLGTDITLPDAKYFTKGTKATYTVPAAPDSARWVAIDKNTGVTISDTSLKSETNKDGSITYSIDKITQPIQFILTDGKIIVQYTANLEYSDREPLGNLFKDVSKQNIIEDGTVKNQATYAETVSQDDSSTYTVLSPDSDRVKVRATESFGSGKRAEPRDYYYTFQGWQVEGTNIIIDPKKSLTDQLGKNLAVVKLHAKWEALDDQKRPNTVNFYLSTACEIMDNMSNGFAGQAKSAFTTTIYSTRIYGTDRLTIDSSQTADNGDFQILAPADTASTAYRTDTTLRNSVNTKFTSAAITSGNQLSLESFPTDEEILESLKDRMENGDEGAKTTVTMDGEEIQADELTTTNFAVRWYVLKYHNSDAWHIDGVLVAKQARAVVTKTFAGDEDAIEAVKESGYSISVTHNHKQGEDDHTDYILSLNPDYQELRQGYVGYTRYDEDTDTYTWVLTARQNREYTLTEHRYEPPGSTDGNSVTYDGTYQYMIENSDTGDTTDWQTYPEKTGIQLTAQAYPEDAPEDSYQRVSFRNIYVRDGLLTVMKADAATGRGLGKVQFRISRVDKTPISVYRKYTEIDGKTEYQNQYKVVRADINDAEQAKDTSDQYELVEGNILTTDGTGLFQVYLPVDSSSRSAEYYLEETLPLGYDGPTKLKVTVSDNGEIQHITEVVKPTTGLPDGKKWITGENTAMLTINNYSKILTTVTAQKQWDDTVPPDERKSVKVELWRNGVKMTDTTDQEYTQTLDSNKNWSYTWNNLPLFVDGEIANYQLREVQINDTKYDLEAGSNGYKDYVVSYDATKYLQHLDGEGDLKTLDPLSKTNLAKWNSDEASTTPYWGEGSNRTYAQHALLVVRNSKKAADITFTKTDGLGSPLQGALFGMYADAECKHLLSQSKSDANGQVQFVSRDGYMYIKEISAPEGCTLDETVYQVVTDDGDKKVLKKVSDTSSTVNTIANKSHINLLIQKVDNNGNALTGAEFKIEKLNTKTNTYETFGQGTYTVSSTDGIVQITDDNGARLNFDEGKYRITETETPGKLYRNAGSIIVTVQGGQVYYEKAESDTDIDSWKMEQRENTVIYTLQVVNTPWYALPSTGGNSYAALVAALGAAIMCGASALALWLRKRREHR